MTYVFSNWRHELGELEAAIAQDALETLSRDKPSRYSILYRFIRTYERMWKALNHLLSIEWMPTDGPQNTLRKAAQCEWLSSDDHVWSQMTTDRYAIEETSGELEFIDIYQNVKTTYAPQMRHVFDRLTHLYPEFFEDSKP